MVAPQDFYKNQKSISLNIGGIAATNQKFLWSPNVKCTITDVRLISDITTASSSGSAKYDFQIANLTASTDLLSAVVSTDDTEITADTVYSLKPNQNGAVNENDVIEFQVTKTGAPTDLSSAEIIIVIDYLPTATV